MVCAQAWCAGLHSPWPTPSTLPTNAACAYIPTLSACTYTPPHISPPPAHPNPAPTKH